VTRFVLRRAAMIVPILLGVSIVVFITLKLIPGDPVASLLGPTSTPEARADLIHKYGLDKPLPTQYATWLGNVVRGDLGRSIARQQAARPMVVDAFRNTLILTGFALVIATVGGLVLGAVSALRRGKPSGGAASGIAIASLSTPQYSVGLMLIIYLSVRTGWFPSGGMYKAGQPKTFGDLVQHAVLPAITAALVPMGILARMFRSALLDALGQDWVEALRARGLPERRILGHAFHNSLPAVLTIAGLQFGYLAVRVPARWRRVRRDDLLVAGPRPARVPVDLPTRHRRHPGRRARVGARVRRRELRRGRAARRDRPAGARRALTAAAPHLSLDRSPTGGVDGRHVPVLARNGPRARRRSTARRRLGAPNRGAGPHPSASVVEPVAVVGPHRPRLRRPDRRHGRVRTSPGAARPERRPHRRSTR
jgi:peptide/nickel transport system permease protein